MEFRKFPSIAQFRNAIQNVRSNAKYNNKANPKLKFKGTVKLHGTNSAIGYDIKTGEKIYQSRENVLSLRNDNKGFCAWAMKRDDVISTNIDNILKHTNAKESIYLYGEFIGKGIQKKVAVSELEKKFVIFAVVADGIKIDLTYYKTLAVNGPDLATEILSISDFPSWEVEIDFDRPELAQNQLIDLTIAVETECPVGKFFGVIGTGEGIVWENIEEDIVFKVKGEKHSATKVKTIKEIAAVDIIKIENMYAFADLAVSENRLEQGLQKLTELGFDNTDNKNTGEFIRWVCSDIFREEADAIVENEYSAKALGNRVAYLARVFYLNRIL